MVYRYINGEIAIARVFDDFKVTVEDWVSRSPYWIARALESLPVVSVLEQREEDIKIYNNIGILPCSLKSITAIIYNGYKINRKGYINPGSSSEPYYALNNNDTITFFVSNCTVHIKYKSIPSAYNEKYQVEIPKIPDVEEVIEYIQWSLLAKILSRGYRHNLFTYSDVYNIIKEKKRDAVISISAMDLDERDIIGNEISSIGNSDDYDIDIYTY